MTRADKVIANSVTTRILLSYLYGINSHGLAYPPVDTSVFRPGGTKDNRLTLFLGTNFGDCDEKLTYEACRHGITQDLQVHTFGNDLAIPKPFGNQIIHHSSLPDIDLAKVYAESLVVVAPQSHETFGYVPIEAAACGTPTIVGYMHDAEKNGDDEVVKRANAKDLPQVFDSFLKNSGSNASRDKCVSFARHYSIENSARSLSSVLEA